MSAVLIGYANPTTPSFEPNLPGSAVGPTGPVGPAGPAGAAGAAGATGPPGPGATGPLTQYGTVALSTNGQTVALPVPYTSSMQVFVQGTSNAAGVNGFFTVLTAGSLSEFRIFYSGELIYGPIQMFWFAVGE
jgi:hypothetical protein